MFIYVYMSYKILDNCLKKYNIILIFSQFFSIYIVITHLKFSTYWKSLDIIKFYLYMCICITNLYHKLVQYNYIICISLYIFAVYINYKQKMNLGYSIYYIINYKFIHFKQL